MNQMNVFTTTRMTNAPMQRMTVRPPPKKAKTMHNQTYQGMRRPRYFTAAGFGRASRQFDVLRWLATSPDSTR